MTNADRMKPVFSSFPAGIGCGECRTRRLQIGLGGDFLLPEVFLTLKLGLREALRAFR
jgi:hypothetical protein